MKLNSKGQVTIPAPLRVKHGLRAGDEIEVVEDADALRIVRVHGTLSQGRQLVRRLRGKGSASKTQGMTTDQLMELLRGE